MSKETFKKELQELMKKHNAVIEVNHDYGYNGEDEYICDTEVCFKIGTEKLHLPELEKMTGHDISDEELQDFWEQCWSHTNNNPTIFNNNKNQ